MKNIHHNTIKYLTYLVLNKRKLDNEQSPVLPYPITFNIFYDSRAHLLIKRHNTLYCFMDNHDQHKANGLTITPIPGYGHYFFFFFIIIWYVDLYFRIYYKLIHKLGIYDITTPHSYIHMCISLFVFANNHLFFLLNLMHDSNSLLY